MSEQSQAQVTTPAPHPVSGAVHAWNNGRLLALVVFKRVGDWAITCVAHAGKETEEPWLGAPSVTWMGEDHEFGRKLGTFIAYSDQETEILEALRLFTPYSLRSAFNGKAPLIGGEYVDAEMILHISQDLLPGGSA